MLLPMDYEDEQPPFNVDLVPSTRTFFTGARVLPFKEKLREDLLVRVSLGARPHTEKCSDREHPEKVSASETIVEELLQKIVDLKPVSKVGSPLSRTRRSLLALQGKFGHPPEHGQKRHKDLVAVNWIQAVTLGDSRDVSFIKPERILKGRSKSSELASSQFENCPECDHTVIEDHFSFRSKEEVIRDGAMDSHFESFDTESHEEGLDDGSSAKPNPLAEVLALRSLFTKPGSTNQVAPGVETDAAIDQDDLMTTFASVFKQQIEDALEPLRGPIAFVFQSREEAERKRRENLLAVEEKKLALRRKKIQSLKPRRGRRCQRRRRASSAKSSRLTHLGQGASPEACSDAVNFSRR